MRVEAKHAISEGQIEQRRFPRLACHTALQYRDILQPRAPYVGSLTHDLSAGGIRFQSVEWLAAQHRLLVQLRLPGASEPIRTIAQVVWTRKQSHGDHYEVGARFIEMTAYDREAVAGFVERTLRPAR